MCVKQFSEKPTYKHACLLAYVLTCSPYTCLQLSFICLYASTKSITFFVHTFEINPNMSSYPIRSTYVHSCFYDDHDHDDHDGIKTTRWYSLLDPFSVARVRTNEQILVFAVPYADAHSPLQLLTWPTVARGERYSNDCPTGYSPIMDYDTCKMAAGILTDTPPHSNGIGFQAILNYNDASFPAGCFYFYNHHSARFNNAKQGSGNGNAYRICTRKSWLREMWQWLLPNLRAIWIACVLSPFLQVGAGKRCCCEHFTYIDWCSLHRCSSSFKRDYESGNDI